MRATARCSLVLILLIVWSGIGATSQTRPAPEEQTMTLDVNNTDIADVVRTISTGYGLSIILDKDVSGKVTVNLTGVPIMEGLHTIAASLGLEVVREGSVYRVRRQTPQQRSMIRYIRGKLTVDVQDVEVKEFLKEISSQTAVSIVPDAKISGKITGKLFQVDLEDGLRGLLEGNGFSVTKRRNIFYVGLPEIAGAAADPARRMVRGRTGSGSFHIDYNNGRVTLDVTSGKLDDVIKAIADQSDIEIVTYGNLGSAEVNAKLNDIPLAEALALLLGGTMFTFIQQGSIILIGDRNPGTNAGQALSKSELVHLRFIKADEVPKILPTDLMNKVKVVKEQNALLVTGTSEDIVKTREFLRTIDLSTPQVIIDALVVEYSRDVDRDFGLRFGRGKRVATAMSYPNLEGTTSGTWLNALFNQVDEFRKLGQWKLAPDFYAELKLLESQQKAKILAQPSVTVLNGNKAEIDVSQTQYFKIVTGTLENQLYQFRPISFGINLKITPWISRSGQITADINPVISNATGMSQDGYPNVFQRSVATTVRFENGETLVLGGLLRSDVLVAHDKVPLLGDLPLLGMLFRTTKKKNIQTNLVIYITPRIAEGIVDLEKELTRFDHEEKHNLFRDENFSDILKSQTGFGAGTRKAAKVTVTPAQPVSPVPDTLAAVSSRPQSLPLAGAETDTVVTDTENQPDSSSTPDESEPRPRRIPFFRRPVTGNQ